MADVETLTHQVWNREIRGIVNEALRCHGIGAARASIGTTWTAITTDIITKLVYLADAGDAAAVVFRTDLEAAQLKGINAEGVKAMQRIEASLLDKAVEFQLIDPIGKQELEQIQQTRNLCAHPSLREHGGAYDPLPDVARAHLAVALTTLLVHPPTQGRRALEQFQDFICDPTFVAAPAHIQVTFFDRVRRATRRTIIRFAAKHAILELNPAGRLDPATHADRMALALDAFVGRDRDLVRSAVAEQIDQYRALSGETQVRALIRLGVQDYFWDSVDSTLAAHLEALTCPAVEPLGLYSAVPPETANALAIVRSAMVRERIPKLEARFRALATHHQMVVVAAHPDPYFVSFVVSFLERAGGWRTGEQAGKILVQHAEFLTLGSLKDALTWWAKNSECRTASDMPELAVTLFQDTVHLGATRVAVFREFLDLVLTYEDPGSFYTYPVLAGVLAAAP